MRKNKVLDQIRGRLIVSCQSEPPEPLAAPEMLAAMAMAAEMGGAAGIRANLPENIKSIKKAIDLPVIGIFKKVYPGFDVFITPTENEAFAVAKSGCEIIALDATRRKRPNDEKISDIIKAIRQFDQSVLLMADIATPEEGFEAAEAGFDLIGTTLSGYTDYTKKKAATDRPDFDLLEGLAKRLSDKVPVIAEGRIRTPEQARQALDFGAFAVVVGSAITRPWLITKRFADAIENRY